ncbi:MAG: hypothetical protein NC098_05545 [Lachnoclostridium sp.]|nr:hypothetical protein [Lachnoclostridium sp.]
MTDYIDVDSKLDQYSEAFDFYMERGEMPPVIEEDDCLAGYMQEVIDSNPQIDGNDPTWVEVLKEDLITFFGALLEQYRVMQLEAMQELELIEKFAQAPIEEKRQMWQQVAQTISNGYSRYEVNLPGYIDQFKGDDKEAVFKALTGDWKDACMGKLQRREQQLLDRSKPQFEKHCRECGAVDYDNRKRVDAYVHRYPQLQEIVDMIGRDKNPSDEEKDTVIYKFLPITVAQNSSVEEIDRVETGNNLERVLPVELSMPETLFFKRYATKELQQFSSPGKDKPHKVEDHKRDCRLTKGPIIVSIDTSASMNGQPQKIAFSLLKQLLRVARKQKRPCFLISFSVRAQSIDLSRPRNWKRVDSFLEHGFSGGTNGEQMLSEAIRVLQGDTFEMADVLIISDLQFPQPMPSTLKKIYREKTLGTRFYALQIGQMYHDYFGVMDKIWQV